MLSLFVLFSFIACQENGDSTKKVAEATIETKQEATIEKYYIRFLQEEKETRAEASFFTGSNFEEAQARDIEAITFQDRSMKAQNLGARGIRYFYRSRVPYNTTYKFTYNEKASSSQQRQFEMDGIEEFLIKEGKVDRSDGITLVWKGEALDSTQSMVLMFTDENKKASYTTIEGPTETPEIKINSDQLANLSPGKGELYLVKKQNRSVQEHQAMILASMEFYTRPIKIEVQE